ncbi:MAG TPA: RNA polymerase sigma factor [Polyangiales bacterium]|nr:RNA polymerase sigma factor [Polyangiales bacterium]
MDQGDARSDEELMAAYVAGNAAAFHVLFQRYAAVLFRLARRRLTSDEDARDVVQQTLLQLHRARNDFRAGARLRPWLFTIAMNLVREHYRKQRRRREQSLESAPLEAEPVSEPAEAEAARDRSARVRAALAGLPDNQREVIELHWFESCPYEDIAQIVGASVAAVRVRAHRGYERLREILPELE